MNPQLQAMLQQAIQAFQEGYFERSVSLLNRVIQVDAKCLPALQVMGLIHASQQQFSEAAYFLARAARISPNDPSIQYNLAKCLMDSGSDKESIPHHKKTTELSPNNSEAWLNYGRAASNIGRHEDALTCFSKALRLNPNFAEAALNQGATLKDLKRYDEAIEHYDKALSLKPGYAEGWFSKGLVLHELNRYDEAITQYDQALSLKPDYVEAWTNKGLVLHELKRYDEAIAHYDQALSLKPDYAAAWGNKGNALYELKRYNEAIAHYDRALSLKPDYAEAWTNKGATLHELKRYDEAIAHYDKALSLKPDYAEAWTNKGTSLNECRDHVQSAKCFLMAHQLNKKDSYLMGQAHHQMMLVCDWSDYEKIKDQLCKQVQQGKKSTEPFGFQGIATSEELLKKCAEIYSIYQFPVQEPLSMNLRCEHRKIRIGYLCGEFREQATSILMTRSWELHDPMGFEIYAFDSGWNDQSEYRRRIENTFKSVLDISSLSDIDAAKLIASHEIDILVNLNGFFGKARQGVFAYRPAPIQVNYLGFPGTIGAKYVDYIIADNIVIPEQSRDYYMEKIAYLPDAYQANDNFRKISERQFSRSELGLPGNAFIFASFNNSYKITPTTFDSWARIISAVDNSILWLLADNPTARANLIKEALARGIASEKLIFADRMPLQEHLSRHRLADLFLDTLPYNAHTTCSDALWAGLPFLTQMGETFPGRVAASLLNAVGLPELITTSQEQYEALAIELATNPQKLAALKLKLANNRLTTPLFDSPLFTKNLEAVYIKMIERYQANLPPDHILAV